jgi:molecular chaperone DnaJ
MTKRDYYEVLGVDKDVDSATLKKSYRKLAMQFHPDKNPDNPEAEEKFKEASEAYEVLHDQEKRALYDRFGHDGLRQSGFGGFQGFDDIVTNFGDIFEDFFGMGGGQGGGRGRRRDQPMRGADLRKDLEIDFVEAAKGVEREMDIEKYVTCERCNGSRSEPTKSASVCSTCQGAGKVTRSQGFFAISSTCPTCHGHGEVITDPCKKCRGTGQTIEAKTLSVKAPAGVDTGSTLRLRGEGEPGRNGGPAGDLYVVLHVQPHDIFERHEDDIVVNVDITYAQAALGADIMVPTLEEETEVVVEAGTQSGSLHRISGMGIAHLNSYGKGDLIVRFVVKTPTKLSEEQEKLLRQLAELEGSDVRPHHKGFFEKLMS